MKQHKFKGWVLVAIQFALIFLIVISSRFEKSYLNHPYSGIIFIISLVLVSISAVTGLITLINFGQYMTPNPVPSDSSVLRTHGIYSLIRHPMYLTVIIFMFGVTLFSFAYYTLLLDIILVLFFTSKINFEEKLLFDKFPEYESYKNRTKKLIPFIY